MNAMQIKKMMRIKGKPIEENKISFKTLDWNGLYRGAETHCVRYIRVEIQDIILLRILEKLLLCLSMCSMQPMFLG